MKRLTIACIFLLTPGLFAQGIQDSSLAPDTNEYASAFEKSSDENTNQKAKEASEHEEFLKAARYNDIPTREFRKLSGVNNGYYLVTGVYSKEKNAKKHIKKLKRNDLKAAFITHPDTGLRYVYLEHLPNGMEAVDATNFLRSTDFDGDIWILEITDSDPVSAGEEATADSRPGVSSGSTSVQDQKSAEERGIQPSYTENANPSKLVQKADQYFDKMWYAEAAKLYELALDKGVENYSPDIIQKAGDSHYYNTNMEAAYKWYDLLYKRYGNDMSAENLFKYAHSLKGTGKYARAKRLMRLYNRKLADGDVAGIKGENKSAVNEVVLDNILSAEQKFTIKNLAINSEYSDFSPVFHNDNELVYASAMDSAFFNTRRYKWNNQPYLDLYVAKINEETDDVRNAVKFSKEINTKYHEASVSFSPDNSMMYFTRNNYGKKLKRDKNGINHLKIYTSKKVDGEWTEAREVSFNSDNYSTGHPALSPDGKQLYFVSDMPGSIGQTDIFVVDVLGDGQFSEPRNLGPEINTEQREMFPFISEKKLYFSSDGHVGLGGLDVYEITFDEEEGFLELQNMGKPINSKVDDFSYIVNETTQKGYFASNRKGGKGDDDIYSFKRLMVEEVNQTTIAGVVTELVTGDIMPEALVMLLDENNRKLKEVVTGADGSFIFEDLDGNTKYTIKTVKSDFFDHEKVVESKKNEVVSADVSMKRLKELIAVEDGIKKLKVDMIYFDFDKSYIRKDASEELDKLVEVMTEYSEMVIKIESHTDSRGNNVYNKYLSDKRAKSTRDYLITQGISPDRIQSAIGYGEERLLNECDGSVRCSSSKHQLNRRSEFIIVHM